MRGRMHKLFYPTLIISATAIVSAFLLQSTFYANRETSEAIPKIVSKKGFTTSIGGEFSMMILVEVHNEGKPGKVIVGAEVMYEYYQATFTQTQQIYLNYNETKEVMFCFLEVFLVPCSNRHSIQWHVWTEKT